MMVRFQFRCGDVVRLSSGGAAMTVAAREAVECPGGASVRYTVAWTDASDALHIFDIPETSLRRPPADVVPKSVAADVAEHDPDEVEVAHAWRFAVGDAVRLAGRREVGVVAERVYQETGGGNWQAHYTTTLPARDRNERMPLEVALRPASEVAVDVPTGWADALKAIGGFDPVKQADKPKGGDA